MAITLSAKSLRLLKYIAVHGGDQADEQLATALERAIEKVASQLNKALLQEQGTPYGDEEALKSLHDYRVAVSGEPELQDVDVEITER